MADWELILVVERWSVSRLAIFVCVVSFVLAIVDTIAETIALNNQALAETIAENICNSLTDPLKYAQMKDL